MKEIPTTLDILKLLGKPTNWRTVGDRFVWNGSVSPIDLIVEAVESTLKYEADTADRFRLAIGKQISKTEYQRAEVNKLKEMLESLQLSLTTSRNLIDRFCELAGAPGDPLEASSRFQRRQEIEADNARYLSRIEELTEQCNKFYAQTKDAATVLKLCRPLVQNDVYELENGSVCFYCGEEIDSGDEHKADCQQLVAYLAICAYTAKYKEPRLD
jgi:hypothetical protein